MQPVVPDAFIEQVRQVLEHLFDIPYLYQHPLAAQWPAPDSTSTASRAAALRQAAQAAIEALDPGDPVPFRSPHARLHQLMHLHFLEGLTIQETASELAVSERQVYRDLRRGVETVALALWQQQEDARNLHPGARDVSSIDAEVERLDTPPSLVDVGECLMRASRSVARLSEARGVHFHLEPPASPVQFWSFEPGVQQILTSIVSLVVQRASAGTVCATLTHREDGAAIEFCLRLEDVSTPLLDHLPAAANALASRLGWRIGEQPLPDGQVILGLRFADKGPTVLVIDDNEELLELIARFLEDHAVSVTAASSSVEGLRLARSTRPDAILLDVMMPGTDGWEVLQTLKAWPETAAIPIIVCSVFHDPELAYSLGAASILAKPVRRDDVLAALQQLGIV